MKTDGERDISVQHAVHEAYTKGYSLKNMSEKEKSIFPKEKNGNYLLFKQDLSLCVCRVQQTPEILDRACQILYEFKQ